MIAAEQATEMPCKITISMRPPAADDRGYIGATLHRDADAGLTQTTIGLADGSYTQETIMKIARALNGLIDAKGKRRA